MVQMLTDAVMMCNKHRHRVREADNANTDFTVLSLLSILLHVLRIYRSSMSSTHCLYGLHTLFLSTLVVASTRCTTLGERAFPVAAARAWIGMLFRRLFVPRHRCCSSAAN